MPAFRSFEAFGRELGRLQAELERDEKRRITKKLGERAQQIAESAASADLGGDPKFSGWAPTLDTRIRTVRGGAALLTPTRTSAGPWTVAESGRNQGGDRGFQGPGVNRRTGVTSRTKSGAVRKVRSVQGRRWNGVTRGKGTATDAQSRMDRELPKLAEKHVRRVIKKRFDVT